MSLPDLIEIVPVPGPVNSEITVPGSKSITNRALILAALAEGETTLPGALWSEDTQVMVECLQELGYMVNVAPDPAEACNRTITVYGLSGKVPRGGTPEQPLELFISNAGTAARFLAAMVCLGEGVYRLHGVPRMHERPQAALFVALRELGYRIDSPNDRLPALIHGAGPRPGQCTVSLEESSQFASALLLCARAGGWQVEVMGENTEESAYVEMTKAMRKVFPTGGGAFQIEPDASSGSYFWAAGQVGLKRGSADASLNRGRKDLTMEADWLSSVSVARWPNSGWQIDAAFPDVWFALASSSVEMGFETEATMCINYGPNWRENPAVARDFVFSPLSFSRQADLGDSIMTAITVAPFGIKTVTFLDLGRLRVQECERVVALRTELTRCGALVVEEGDSLIVQPSFLHGATIETYNDHRMAMCFAILGLKVPGIRIKNPTCVKKTFPNFFQKLATSPPHGLGVTILDVATRRKLEVGELFAD